MKMEETGISKLCVECPINSNRSRHNLNVQYGGILTNKVSGLLHATYHAST